MTKVKTWVWVVVGIVALGILGIIVVAAAGIWLVRSHIDVRPATAVSASTEFERVRKQFPPQKPLIELDDRDHFLRANTDRAPGTRTPESLHVLAFDPEEDRVVRMSIPFWLLRFKSGRAQIDLGGDRVDLEDLKLTVEDLERYGPAIILDHTGRHGERVLVWSQ
jgi:hypothetical protein